MGRARHRDHTANMGLGVEFGLDLVARSAGSRRPSFTLLCVGAASLDHEALDYSVEGRPVIKALSGELLEVLDRLWADVRPEGYRHFTVGRLYDGLFAGGLVLAHGKAASINSQK